MIQHLTKCGMQVPGDPLGQGTKVGFQFNICGNDGNNKIYLLLCLWRFQEMCAYRTLISLSLINNSADSLKWWYSLLLCDLENSTSEQQRKKNTYILAVCELVWAHYHMSQETTFTVLSQLKSYRCLVFWHFSCLRIWDIMSSIYWVGCVTFFHLESLMHFYQRLFKITQWPCKGRVGCILNGEITSVYTVSLTQNRRRIYISWSCGNINSSHCSAENGTKPSFEGYTAGL